MDIVAIKKEEKGRRGGVGGKRKERGRVKCFGEGGPTGDQQDQQEINWGACAAGGGVIAEQDTGHPASPLAGGPFHQTSSQ